MNRLSSIDVIIAAHIPLIANPPFPCSLIKGLVNSSYLTLVSYTQLLCDQAFEEGRSPIQFTLTSSSIWSLVPSKFKTPDPSWKSES